MPSPASSSTAAASARMRMPSTLAMRVPTSGARVAGAETSALASASNAVVMDEGSRIERLRHARERRVRSPSRASEADGEREARLQ